VPVRVPATLRCDPGGPLRALRYPRLAPLAHVLLRDTEPVLARRLKSDRDRAITVHLCATEMLRQFADLTADIPWVVFKGPVLSELAHPVPGLRDYQDLDRKSTRLNSSHVSISY